MKAHSDSWLSVDIAHGDSDGDDDGDDGDSDDNDGDDDGDDGDSDDNDDGDDDGEECPVARTGDDESSRSCWKIP